MAVPVPPGVGSENLAIRIFKALVGEENASLPDVDLFDDTHSIPWDEDSVIFKPVEKLTIEELVSNFHALMGGFQVHLEKEFEAGRITGAEYAKAYVALTQGAMQNAVQFLLGKDQAFWMAAKTQADAITAQNQNEAMRLEAMLKRAQYALTLLKLASEDSTFGVSEVQRTAILPQQKSLLEQQTEAQHAQTASTLLSNSATPIGGLLGAQKALYEQQVVSFKEDVKIKSAKIFADLWVTQKTIDEGVLSSPWFRPPVEKVDSDGTTNPNNFLYQESLGEVFKNIRALAIGGDDGYTPATYPTT